MSDTEKSSAKTDSKKSSPQRKPYTLKTRVSINGKIKEKGEKVMLTKEGAIAFKRKHRI